MTPGLLQAIVQNPCRLTFDFCTGLRALQSRKQLDNLVAQVQAARDKMQWGEYGAPPLLVKIAPDLTKADKVDVATVALKRSLDGLVISNTTISRPHAVRDHPSGDEVSFLDRIAPVPVYTLPQRGDRPLAVSADLGAVTQS